MIGRILEQKPYEQTILAIVIAVGVIAVWRGFWGLMDLHLFPEDPTFSFIISILIGLAILSATHYTVKELM